MATSVDLNKKKYKYLNLKIYLKNKIKLKREKGLLPNRGVARGYPQNHLGVACGHPQPIDGWANHNDQCCNFS
jgi:hypothetical protein